MPSIKEIARAANVSPSTVSLVLNNKGNISEQTRQRVLEVVREMGYTRSVHARNLRENQSRVFGFAWSPLRSAYNPVLDLFLYEMVRLSEQHGRHLLLFTEDEQEDTENIYRSLIDSRRVDGFILANTDRDDPRFAFLLEANVPFVAFGRSLSAYDEDAYWVDVDGAAGTFAAVSHLVEHGHQHIAMLAWPQGSASGDERVKGYLDALAYHALSVRDDYIVRVLNDVTGGYQGAQQLMQLPAPPTAVVAVSDIIALGALRYFAEHGHRIAVTGFDNTPASEFSHPPLTTLKQPIYEIADLCVGMLLAQITGQEVERRHHLLPPHLIIRASSTLDY
ncbi:MAG: LacI family transcriptional regulator [Chloroflexi bacterium]|nr:MAG: LacI family transcriptional regulator [Chloroflexota bacterium]